MSLCLSRTDLQGAMQCIIIISDYLIADARRLNSHCFNFEISGPKPSTTFYNYNWLGTGHRQVNHSSHPQRSLTRNSQIGQCTRARKTENFRQVHWLGSGFSSSKFIAAL